MQRLLILITFNLFCSHIHSQVTFEKGYIINNSDLKVECLIKNKDWHNNPKSFSYKLLNDNTVRTATLKTVKEFGLDNKFKYIRKKVKIDTSSNKFSELTKDRNPFFKEKEIFLKVLIEGNANLYLYENDNQTRFFYNLDASTIEQLIFKEYLVKYNLVGKNNMFKQQLWNNLTCENIKKKDLDNLNYDKKQLIKYFINYNTCHDYNYINYEHKDSKKFDIRLTAKTGINSSSLYISNSSTADRSTTFDDKIGATFALEAEFVIPYNKNKWSLILEPTYHNYNSEGISVDGDNVTVNYTSIQIPLGIRHSFFIGEKSRIYLNGFYLIDITTNNSIIDYPSIYNFVDNDVKIKSDNNFAFGLGFNHKRYTIECRYSSRDILNATNWDNKYKQFSLIFGYRLF